MPNVIEAPLSPAMLGECRDGGAAGYHASISATYRLPGGEELRERFTLLYQAHFSMDKTIMLDGVPLPAIWL
jgi:hypothetical protein